MISKENIPSQFKEILNHKQIQAVTTLEGPILVIAGAGSGKTRVIEYRVLYLVERNISAKSILLLTFTKRAALEMLNRVSRHNSKCKEVEGGTFHSFGLKVIKKYAYLIGISNNFSVLDEADAEEAIKRCCQKFDFYNQLKRFPTKETLRKIISLSINKNLSIEEILIKEYPHFLEYISEIEKIKKEYQRYKIFKSYLDYDDLLIYLRDLLKREEIQNEISSRYKFIMVDEYQDTNELQGEITYLLGKKHRNIMVVGDDAQSIYSFRGATHKNIMNFPQYFPDCKIITLEENYRSTQAILDLSNALLENMKNKYPKYLVSAKKEKGKKPQLLYFKDHYKEAEWIAAKIKNLRDSGINLSKQAVLFRSAHVSIPLQVELSKRNIPYQVFGGIKFYETAHIKDLLAHLKILVNYRDELSWSRILLLLEGIGEKTANEILERINKTNSLNEIIDEVFKKYIQKNNKKYKKGLEELSELLSSIYKRNISVYEKIKIICEYYRPIFENKFDDWHTRKSDLDILLLISKNYVDIEEFLIDFTLEPPERGIDIEATLTEEEKPLTLSTIHSAKGLEWDVVFIIGLVEGVLPISFSFSREDELEEEERLLYVGVTRAKKDLFLSLPYEGLDHQGYYLNKACRFINLPNILCLLESQIPYMEEDWEREELISES